MNSFSALSSLTPAEKNFLKTKQITAANTPDGWIAFFKKLQAVDASGDKTRKSGTAVGCGGLIVAFVGFILLGAGIGIFVIPIGILLAAIGFGIYFYFKSYDIPGEVLSRTLVPMLIVLREEMKPTEMVNLKLDLRGFALPEKLLKKNPGYARGSYYEIVDSFYRDNWLYAETILADETRLIWNVEDLVRSSHKKKRNPRGKHKSKTKDKHRTLISMQIGMHNKKYTLPEKVKQKTAAEGAIRTKDTDTHSWMSIRKLIKHGVGQSFTPKDFLNTVATAYARATPVSAGGKNLK